MRHLGSIVFAAMLWLLPTALVAQQLPFTYDVPLPGITGHNPDIPVHVDVFGHEIGQYHTRPDQVIEYFEEVAAASDRVMMGTHGMSYGHRKMVHAIVTSPENHARLEEIRLANLRLSDDPNGVDDAELEEMPVVAYLGYSIHGDEASGTEASLLFLYHLAAARGEWIDALLDNTVLIIDPMMNPDGRDRFVDWANGNRGAVHTTDPQDREHNQAWPRGRTNHYYFDLNRDWLIGSHPESKGRIDLFHQWRPQVLTDHHEMGGNSTYFFQPGIPSRTNPYTPQLNQDLTGEIGAYHASRLDGVGSLYYARESFDDFYYGKGSTFPDANGTIGILFEQGSSRALETEVTDGTMHYAYTVMNQFLTSLSTADALVNMRTKLLGYQRDFYQQAPSFARDQEMTAYIVSLTRHRTRAQHMLKTLMQHRVVVHELAESITIDGVTYAPGEAVILPIDQPQSRLLVANFEPMTEFTDSLFYDVSSWAMPMTFDVDVHRVTSNPSRLFGEAIDEVELDGGAIVGGSSPYAYLMPWGRYYSARALYQLHKAGVTPRLMRQPFTANVNGVPIEFDRGAVVIPLQRRDGNGPSADVLLSLLEERANKDHVTFYAVDSGWTPEGPELGGPSSSWLQMPSIALLSGDGTSMNNMGEAWHLLTERMHVPVSLLEVSWVGRADLSRYNTIVMAGGSYGGMDVDALKSWVRQGGRLIATSGSSVSWAIRNELLSLDAKPFDMDSLLKDVAYADVSFVSGAQRIGGSIFEAELDQTHPIAFGFDATIPMFRNSSTFYEPSSQPGSNVAVYTDEPLMSGYLSEEKAEQSGNSASVVAARYGGGRVVAMQDNPNFRAFWYGTNGLFLNAIFFGGAY